MFRTDQPLCILRLAELPLTRWHLLCPSLVLFCFVWGFSGGFCSCFCCCFLVFEFYLTKLQVLLAWPCQHHRLGASPPSWIRSKAWSSRNLHQKGLDFVCSDSAPSPNGLVLVSCFASVRKSVFYFLMLCLLTDSNWPVMLPLKPWWLNPCILCFSLTFEPSHHSSSSPNSSIVSPQKQYKPQKFWHSCQLATFFHL